MAPTVVTPPPVQAGAQITARLPDPPGGLPAGMLLGARVEMPYTRAIVSAYQRGTLDPAAGEWLVTLEGPLTASVYELVWRTDDAEPPYYEVFVPLTVVPLSSAGNGDVAYPPVDTTAVTPTVDEVARLERTRTFHDDGTEVSTFDSATRPTDTECAGLIDQAVSFVLGFLPSAFDPAHYDSTKQVIALYTAMLIEGSFFKEQNLGSPLPWEAEYTVAVQRLEETITEDRSQENVLGVMEPRTTDSVIVPQPPFSLY
jgi:hypothetical protein